MLENQRYWIWAANLTVAFPPSVQKVQVFRFYPIEQDDLGRADIVQVQTSGDAFMAIEVARASRMLGDASALVVDGYPLPIEPRELLRLALDASHEFRFMVPDETTWLLEQATDEDFNPIHNVASATP